MSKRTMTLNLTTREMEVLTELCQKKGLNKTALIRQALRLYQAVELRLDNGDKLIFENTQTDEKSEILIL